MARVDIPAPGDLIMDSAGNVRVGEAVSLKLAGTSTDATHYSALTGGTSTTGGLVSGSDGTIVDGSGNRRYVDSGIALDMTILGRTKQLEPISALVAKTVPLDLRSYVTGTPADMLSAIHSGLADSATLSRPLYMPTPDELGFVPTISGPITPPVRSKMVGVGVYWQEGDALTASVESMSTIKLADGANSAMLRTDYDNSAGKRGPLRTGSTNYWSWFRAEGICFYANGPNQSVDARIIDLRDAWSVMLQNCMVLLPRGTSFHLNHCNACYLLDVLSVGDSTYTQKHLVLDTGSIDNTVRGEMHGCVGPNVTFDAANGNLVEGTFGFALGESLVKFLNGTQYNRFRARLDKAGGHGVYMDNQASMNDIDVASFENGYGTAGPVAGTWAGIYCDGKGNDLKGTSGRSDVVKSGQDHLVIFGPNSGENSCSVSGRDLPSGNEKYLYENTATVHTNTVAS
jgi:hypothetical protein